MQGIFNANRKKPLQGKNWKHYLIAICVFGFVVNTGFFKKNSKAFTLIEAKKISWHSGTLPQNAGIDFELKLNINRNNISFDSLYLPEGAVYLNARPEKGNLSRGKSIFNKNDIAIARASILLKPTETVFGKHPSPNYKGQALIAYTEAGERKYLPVKKFNSLQDTQRQ